jgi:predicted nucleic acid-binding protein
VILVDTSVLINYLKGINNEKTVLFENILTQKLPYGISPYTYQELLQGARNDKEYSVLKDYLSTQIIIFLPADIQTYDEAAELYYKLRRHGITLRSTIDVLIALTAIKNKMPLLHDDRDFDAIASVTFDLKMIN